MSIQRLRAKDDPLGINTHESMHMHALINIVEEFHRQGVKCSRLNKLLRKHADVNPVSHSDHMTRNE